MYGDGEFHHCAFALGVGIVCLYGIVGVSQKGRGREAFALADVLSVRPNKVGGIVGCSGNRKVLSSADSLVAADSQVGGHRVDGDGHILTVAFAVRSIGRCRHIIMGDAVQFACGIRTAGVEGCTALGILVPFVSDAVLSINDVQSEGGGTAMVDIGYIRNSGSGNHGSGGYRSLGTGTLGLCVVSGSIEVVFSSSQVSGMEFASFI